MRRHAKIDDRSRPTGRHHILLWAGSRRRHLIGEDQASEKTELLEYLRNQQKAVAIEAQVNGINIWVLVGAMAVLAWQLVGTTNGRLWTDSLFACRAMVMAVGLHMLSSLIGPGRVDRDELRYSSYNFREAASPYLLLLKGVLLLSPPAYLLIAAGKGIAAVSLGLMGAAFVVMSLVELGRPIFGNRSSPERFPRPEFAPTGRANRLLDLLFGGLFIAALVEQFVILRSDAVALTIEDAKQGALLLVLYLLLLVTVNRKLHSMGIGWTYELETELLLGTISVETAKRRIENRSLGPKLQDVVDRFIDEVDNRVASLDALMEGCKQKVLSAKEVPEEYSAERTARIQAAVADVRPVASKLESDCDDFERYLVKLEARSTVSRKPELARVVGSLRARQNGYTSKLREVKSVLQDWSKH